MTVQWSGTELEQSPACDRFSPTTRDSICTSARWAIYAVREPRSASPLDRTLRVIRGRIKEKGRSEETAQALGISIATVGREQRMAEAWLHREMSGRDKPGRSRA